MKTAKLICAITLSVCGTFCSCSTGSRSEISHEPVGRNDVYQMLYFASLAGSSHNSQPWRVEVSGNRIIRLYADSTRALTVVDSDQRELYISLGAFIENLTLSAGSLGYACNLTLPENHSKNQLVAEIALEKASPIAFDLSLIKNRMTLRTSFSTDAIKENDVKRIVEPEPGCIHFFAASGVEGKMIARQTIEAYTQQAYNKAAQNELANWLRFSDKDVAAKKDGLTTDGMQITGVSGFFVRHFLKPEDSKKESFVKGGIDKAKKQALGCAGWIVITSAGNSVADWINTGRLYQQINLTCTNLKIGFQPMNQIVEEQNYKKQVVKQLGLKGELLFIARVGYVSEMPVPVSPRRPVDEFARFNQ